MATNVNLNTNGNLGQLTYTTPVGALSGGFTPQFVLPWGTEAYTLQYVLAGAGSLQMQKSANDPREVANQSSSSGIPQVWLNVGTASTGGAVQGLDAAGSPTMFRGQVTGGSGSDVLTITIGTAFMNA